MTLTEIRNLGPLHPTLIKKAYQLLQDCEEKGIKIRYSEGFRSVSKQQELYNQGRTTPGQIVTNAPGISYSSQHQWGIAIDFYLNMDVDGDGQATDDAFNNTTNLFNQVGALAKKLGLGWGGDWKSIKDLPHIYLPDWGSTTTTLKQKYGNPETFMQTWNNASDNTVLPDAATESKITPFTEWVKQLQTAIGAKIDGIPGPETLSKTPTISQTKNRKHPAVLPVQQRFNQLGFNCGTDDGIAGPLFDAACKKYQLSIGFKNPDGELTSANRTWKSLLQLK